MAEEYSAKAFLSHFGKGFARPNRFRVELQMPPGVPSSGGYMNKESQVGRLPALGMQLNARGAVQIACHTCTLPGRTMMVYDHSQHSAPFQVPYSQQYTPVTFTFYSDADLRERHFFDAWQTAVVNINDNSMNFYDEYTQDITIQQLDRDGKPTYEVKLYACWPLAIAETQYNYGENNSVLSISVTMNYKLWKSKNDSTEIIIY